MTEIIALLVLLAGGVVSLLGIRYGTMQERERARRIAVEAEARKREQAAKDAGEAMRSAAKERDDALKRPASTVVGDAIRRGQ